MVLPDGELERRRRDYQGPSLQHHTPWEEIYRANVGQLAGGGVLELATKYHKIKEFIPRDSH